MKKIRLPLLILAFSASISVSAQQFREEVVKGDPVVNMADYPWAVQLYSSGTPTCTGILIGDRWVLTAAHCVVGKAAKYTDVVAGSTVLLPKATMYQKSTASRIVTHENYLNKSSNDDIALIELEQAFLLNPYTQPISFIDDEDLSLLFNDGTPCEYSGWGINNANTSKMSDTLRKGSFVTMDASHAIAKTIIPDDKVGTTILVVPDKKENLICNGDSGGPLVWHKDGNPQLIGIASRTISYPVNFGCTAGLALFTQPNHYKDWIQTVMTGANEYMPMLTALNINDTLHTCDGKFSPAFELYNYGKVPFTFLNLKLTLTEESGTLVEEEHSIFFTDVPVESNWSRTVDLRNYGISLPVENGKNYTLTLELLNYDKTPINHPYLKPYTRPFHVAPSSKKLYLYYEETGYSISNFNRFGLRPFNTTSQALKEISHQESGFFWKKYKEEEYAFEIPNSSNPNTKKFILRDTFCVTESCYMVTGNMGSKLILYQDSDKGPDTLFAYKTILDVGAGSFCMRNEECKIKNGTLSEISPRNGTQCKDSPVKLYPRTLENRGEYTYHWVKEGQSDVLGTEDTLVLKDFALHYVLIQSKTQPACKSVAYAKPLWNNMIIPLIRREANSLFASINVQHAVPVWYHNGRRLENFSPASFVPERDGTYHLRYYTLQNTGDTCWSFWESNKVHFVLSTTGVQDQLNSQNELYRVYPIPVQDELSIERFLPSVEAIHSCSVYDLNGQLIRAYTNQEPEHLVITLNTQGIKTGVYLLKMESDNAVYTRLFNKW